MTEAARPKVKHRLGAYKCFAKLHWHDDRVNYISSLSVTMGRERRNTSTNPYPDIVIGKSAAISRIHAKISWNPMLDAFEFKCLSANGAFVNGKFLAVKSDPIKLDTQSLIQISDQFLYFLLPSGFASSHRSGEEPPSVSVSSDPVDVDSSAGAVKRDERDVVSHLRKELLAFGFGNWTPIRSRLGPTFTIAQVQAFARAFVELLLTHDGPSDLRKLLASEPPAPSASTSSSSSSSLSPLSGLSAQPAFSCSRSGPPALESPAPGHETDTADGREQGEHSSIPRTNEDKESQTADPAPTPPLADTQVPAEKSENDEQERERPAYWTRVIVAGKCLEKQKNVLTWARKLLSMHVLLTAAGGSDFASASPSPAFSPNLLRGRLRECGVVSKPPAVWWTATHDLDLLLGFLRHGYGNFSALRTDPNLSFSRLFMQNGNAAVVESPLTADLSGATERGADAVPSPRVKEKSDPFPWAERDTDSDSERETETNPLRRADRDPRGFDIPTHPASENTRMQTSHSPRPPSPAPAPAPDRSPHPSNGPGVKFERKVVEMANEDEPAGHHSASFPRVLTPAGLGLGAGAITVDSRTIGEDDENNHNTDLDMGTCDGDLGKRDRVCKLETGARALVGASPLPTDPSPSKAVNSWPSGSALAGRFKRLIELLRKQQLPAKPLPGTRRLASTGPDYAANPADDTGSWLHRPHRKGGASTTSTTHQVVCICCLFTPLAVAVWICVEMCSRCRPGCLDARAGPQARAPTDPTDPTDPTERGAAEFER
jgi:hypothetical protein